MDNFYEIATIVLGCIVVGQHFRMKKHSRRAQRLLLSLDKIAHKEWHVVTTSDGFEVTDKNGEMVMGVRGVAK